MAEKASLSFRDHNPDVLTSIANLSNDEVFTPPDFANKILDQLELSWALSNGGEKIWSNSEVKFLDPFTKSGVFLREITRRLSEGLSDSFPDVQARLNHITKNQVFGIAVTELTSLLSRRSVYCSKLANGPHSISRAFTEPDGNIWFKKLKHTFSGGTIRVVTTDETGKTVEAFTNGRCIHCGASQLQYDRDIALESHAYALLHSTEPQKLIEQLFGESMKFDVVIGNPPYQLSDGDDVVGASPIYNKFVEQAKKLEPRFLCMVIPARWYSGGKGLDSFRDEMLKDRRIRILEDFPDSTNVFPGTQIKGGVCYFLWDRDNEGPASVRNHLTADDISEQSRYLLENGADVFIRYNQSVSILQKVVEKITGSKSSLTLPENDKFMNLVGTAKPFGFRTFFRASETSDSGTIKIYQNGGVGYVNQEAILKSAHLINEWKVFIPSAGSGSDSFPHPILGKPFVGEPNSVCSETYNVIGPFNSESQAQNVTTYIATKIFRFLVLLHKSSQHANRNVYTFVPVIDFDRPWTDDELVSFFGLSPDETAFIDSMVRPMELGDE